MSITDLSSALASVREPFGSWPMDQNHLDRATVKRLYTAETRFIAVFQDKYTVKLMDNSFVRIRSEFGTELDHLLPDVTETIERELSMMLLAGDCSVTPLGRLFDKEKLYGFIMPYETPVVPPSDDPIQFACVSPELTRIERLNLINQLCSLVSRLHAKRIIHGDIKPSNLLVCSDGELRFCDFAGAAVNEEKHAPSSETMRYTSPFRIRFPMQPLSIPMDLHAAGVSIWEIYTGRMPFDDIRGESELEEFIQSGGRPDISAIDDPSIAKLVVQYLDAGDPPLPQDVFLQARETCLAIDIPFRFCLARPSHTYREVRRCELCVVEAPSTECSALCIVSSTGMETVSSLICTRCRAVEYQGLTGV